MFPDVLVLVSIDLIAIIGELIVFLNSVRNKKDVGQPVFNTLIASLMFVTFTDLISWFCMEVNSPFGFFVGSVTGFCNYLFPNISWWIWLIYAYSFISLRHTKKRSKAFFIFSSIPQSHIPQSHHPHHHPPNKNTKKKCGEMLANSKKSANFALAKGPSGGMVDAHVSGACAARREGSSPFLGTFFKARSTAHLHHVQCLVY